MAPTWFLERAQIISRMQALVLAPALLTVFRVVASVIAKPRGKACCEGILIEFPRRSNHHLSYPFGLHSERDILWNYSSTGDKFYIQAKKCRKPVISKGSACKDCRALTSLPLYICIMMDRIRHGVHENTPLVYHGVGGIFELIRRTEQVQQLRLTKLNKGRHVEAQSGGAKKEIEPEKQVHLEE